MIRYSDLQFNFVLGDTAPNLQFTFYRTAPSVDPTLEDLSGSTVTARLYDATLATPVFNDRVLAAVDSNNFSVSWEATDFQNAGLYHLQLRVTYDDGTIETLPYRILINVVESL